MLSRGIPYLFLAFVAVCLSYAFSHRSGPPLPETSVRIDSTMIMGATSTDSLEFAVGERGRIFRRETGSAEWTAVASPTESSLTNIRFVNNQLGLAVGHDQVILRTTDGGKTWAQVNLDIEAETPLFDVMFVSPDYAIAVGAYGLYMDSRDGGQTWDSRPISDLDWHHNAIQKLSDTTLLIAGEAGTVLRSEDAGENWSVVPVSYQGSYFGAQALSENQVLIFGMRGHVLRSDDAGQNFVEVTHGSQSSMFGSCACGDGKLRLVGQNGTVMTSEDNGQTFTVSQLEGSPMLAGVMVSGDTLVALGQGGQHLAKLN
ncbi:MAG: YCF48-related protein [Moraxellaceae bacterium]|nr:YCF48-related protein [Moraxellaceae bacterium]MDP1775409.1 YCF48-related protein [Moraxellaceae bacterium]MDZ4297142.1 YCF48-related protein [Moraxellaceae bacterium]MDZ4387936.1 YCF48-related protein [Moraxellaceae bacterium]